VFESSGMIFTSMMLVNTTVFIMNKIRVDKIEKKKKEGVGLDDL